MRTRYSKRRVSLNLLSRIYTKNDAWNLILLTCNWSSRQRYYGGNAIDDADVLVCQPEAECLEGQVGKYEAHSCPKRMIWHHVCYTIHRFSVTLTHQSPRMRKSPWSGSSPCWSSSDSSPPFWVSSTKWLEIVHSLPEHPPVSFALWRKTRDKKFYVDAAIEDRRFFQHVAQ